MVFERVFILQTPVFWERSGRRRRRRQRATDAVHVDKLLGGVGVDVHRIGMLDVDGVHPLGVLKAKVLVGVRPPGDSRGCGGFLAFVL